MDNLLIQRTQIIPFWGVIWKHNRKAFELLVEKSDELPAGNELIFFFVKLLKFDNLPAVSLRVKGCNYIVFSNVTYVLPTTRFMHERNFVVIVDGLSLWTNFVPRVDLEVAGRAGCFE